ncbi:MAG: cob(I)yrinic acid a,c-diamide adenosyltransferase [Planctomycetales bacterium]|nr:cob(I)yrinic acid a,c-diamide adenosyltransferase [Planctomycetales bacterium]MCA9183320.1 cob(I)yrinic acid a,c-diamide adenosyltransferase [Planctomycetales bacterium]
MKIYTKTGDCGTTGLFAGPRVDKDHPRIEAYGVVDELCAVLGLAVATLSEVIPPTASATSRSSAACCASSQASDAPAAPDGHVLQEFFRSVQSDLFSIGAELATPDPVRHGMCLLTEQRIAELEQWIDRLDAQLPALEHFILPGGSSTAAMLHLGRTVCRRAERKVVGLSHAVDVHDCRLIVIYLNRLSDLLFVIARYVNVAAGVAETVWTRPTSVSAGK